MSRTLLEAGPLGVGTFTGPGATAGPHRQLWQFTVRDGSSAAVLSHSELVELLACLLAEAGAAIVEAATARAAVRP
jgi:recombinational DNA repair ATPase RecF